MICRHFGVCGGCATQDLAYADELRRKEARLAELFGRPVEVRPSPREFHYRTRMDYVFAFKKLGLRKKGDAKGVIHLEECLLISPRAWKAVQAVHESAVRHEIDSYSFVSHKGYLRYVVVREAPASGELMIVLLTASRDPKIRAVLDDLEPHVDAAAWTFTDREADVSFGEVVEVRKRGWIEEVIGGKRFRFGPNSFFQGNPWQTEALYRHVAERAEGRVTDLFCGVGGFSMFAASRATEIVGIDNNAEAIELARHNAAANGVTNARFFVGDSGRFAEEMKTDTLILDPPRAGLGPKFVRKVVRAAPKRILYISCNPRSLAEELPQFEGYRVEDLRGFDLFPKTTHVETVAILAVNQGGSVTPS